MKLLSIDVGIKNLAFCLFSNENESKELRVSKWDIVNLAESESWECGLCKKPAKFKKETYCYCLAHAKKQKVYLVPGVEQKAAFIKKQTIAKLSSLIQDTYKLPLPPQIKKADLVSLLNNHIQKVYLEPIESKSAKELDLFTAGTNLRNKFNAVFQDVDTIDHVIIENQIGPLAIRMKTIQGMIVQYFVMSSLQVKHVEFISASNKLKDCDTKDKAKYSDRKKLGITKCIESLTTDKRFSEHQAYFESHKKKDDLSDAFLQGMWYIKMHPTLFP